MRFSSGTAVSTLRRARAEIDARGRDGLTALCFAAARGPAEVGRLLLEAGADPRAANRSKETALQHPSGISYAVPVRFVNELMKGR